LEGWKDRLFSRAMAPDFPYVVAIEHSSARPIPSNRNLIWKKFRDRKIEKMNPDNGKREEVPWGDWLMMVDSDVVPPPDPFEWTEDPDKDVVVFPCPIWRDGQVGLNIRIDQDSFDRILGGEKTVPAVQAGTGCFMVRRRVVEDNRLRFPFADRFDRDGIRVMGEDGDFSEKLIEAGYTIWVAVKAICWGM